MAFLCLHVQPARGEIAAARLGEHVPGQVCSSSDRNLSSGAYSWFSGGVAGCCLLKLVMEQVHGCLFSFLSPSAKLSESSFVPRL